ncbi:hypothetical protein FACS189468_5720 [Spirochaetia bacterium]|nr:hypothetical protein FACS189468_5720 [Spirochaetia bacterium]
MKKILFLAFFIGFTGLLFSLELGSLEKRIINATPEEMKTMILNANAREFQGLYNQYEDYEEDELLAAYKKAFPKIDVEYDLPFMVMKLVIVLTLGSEDQELIEQGIGFIQNCLEVVALIEIAEGQGFDTEEIAVIKNNRYWNDCAQFVKTFDLTQVR